MPIFYHQKPAFVSVQNEKFKIQQDHYHSLRVFIIKIQPVRKFFRNGKLECYSMDGKISRSKKYCVFCDEAWRCQKKIRLSMIMLDSLNPIVLDINQSSFEGLQKLVDQYKEELQSTPVTMKIVYDENDKKAVEFSSDD